MHLARFADTVIPVTPVTKQTAAERARLAAVACVRRQVPRTRDLSSSSPVLLGRPHSPAIVGASPARLQLLRDAFAAERVAARRDDGILEQLPANDAPQILHPAHAHASRRRCSAERSTPGAKGTRNGAYTKAHPRRHLREQEHCHLALAIHIEMNILRLKEHVPLAVRLASPWKHRPPHDGARARH